MVDVGGVNEMVVFKLDHGIADEIETKFAELEISGLIGRSVHPVKNLFDVALKFCQATEETRLQDDLLKDLAYGRVQGYSFQGKIEDMAKFVNRLAYTREIYVFSDKASDTHLNEDYGRKVNVRVYQLACGVNALRIVTHTYYFENMRAVVYFSYARERQRSLNRVKENVDRLIDHMINGTYYIPKHPRSAVYKEVEDLFEERKEERLYLSHALGPGYKAKFHPRMIKALLNYVGVSEGPVLDPFVGSGTTSIECSLMNITSVGVDISPVCIYAHTRPKIAMLNVPPDQIESAITDLNSFLETDNVKLVPTSLKEKYQTRLSALQDILKIKDFTEENLDGDISDVFRGALCRTISESLSGKRKSSAREFFLTEIENILRIAIALDHLKERLDIQPAASENIVGDVRRLLDGDTPLGSERFLRKGAIEAVITSPPYSTAVDYIKNDRAILDILFSESLAELESKLIGNPHSKNGKQEYLDDIRRQAERFRELPNDSRTAISKILEGKREDLAVRQYRFLLDMTAALNQMFVSLKNGGRCIVIIGSNHFVVQQSELEFKNSEYLKDIGLKIGFEFQEMIDRNLLKTSYGAIRQEQILILTKP